jgi:hypothetical protein
MPGTCPQAYLGLPLLGLSGGRIPFGKVFPSQNSPSSDLVPAAKGSLPLFIFACLQFSATPRVASTKSYSLRGKANLA